MHRQPRIPDRTFLDRGLKIEPVPVRARACVPRRPAPPTSPADQPRRLAEPDKFQVWNTLHMAEPGASEANAKQSQTNSRCGVHSTWRAAAPVPVCARAWMQKAQNRPRQLCVRACQNGGANYAYAWIL